NRHRHKNAKEEKRNQIRPCGYGEDCYATFGINAQSPEPRYLPEGYHQADGHDRNTQCSANPARSTMNVSAIGRHQNRLKKGPEIPSSKHDTVEEYVGWVVGSVEVRPEIKRRGEADQDDKKHRPRHANIECAAGPSASRGGLMDAQID